MKWIVDTLVAQNENLLAWKNAEGEMQKQN